jgi:hypothetical protein
VSAFEDAFKNYSEQMAGFLQADKLYRILTTHARDDTEVYGVVDQELCGLEHQSAATKLKVALLRQYRDTVPVHVAVELVCKLREDGEL